MDVEETDRRILAYQRENAEQIDVQASQEEREAELVRLQDEEERRLRRERALEFAKRDEEDRRERMRDETELINALEQGEGSVDKILRKQKAVALKRSSARVANNDLPPNTASGRPSLLSKYLQYNKAGGARADPVDEFAPEDPMSDYDTSWYDYRDLFVVRQSYEDPTGAACLRDPVKQLAGGFDVSKSVWERALRSAVMGLWTVPLHHDQHHQHELRAGGGMAVDAA